MFKLFIFDLFALFVLVVQFFTGFFIEPEIQVLLLGGINAFARMTTGRDLISGALIAPVTAPYNITTKKIYESRLFWLSVVGVLGAGIQIAFGWVVEPKYYAVALSFALSLIAKITKRPIKLQ
jgi:hypothetical protein